MKEYKLTQQYLGYQSKKDVTNVDVRFLAPGSQNVLINDGEKIVSSPGYSLDGPSSSASGGSNNKYDWVTSKNLERNLRCLKSGKIQYRFVDSVGDITYRDLFTFTAGLVPRFAEWWSDTEKDDLLLFVIGNANLYMWSGGVTTVASTTVNTITKNGTTSWKEEKFLSTGGSNTIVIGGVEYAYTGGADTTTLTGVTPDPSAVSANSVAHQKVTTHSNIPASGVKNNYIGIHKNQIYLGSDTTRSVYISKNNDYLTYTFTNPRVPGEGALLTLDAPCKGFVTQEDAMYVAAGKDMWFQVVFTLSSDNTKEAVNIQKLKSGPRQGAISQELISQIKNSIIYVSNEPTLDTLGRVENINTPQSKPLSDPIKPDFKDYNFAGGNMVFFESQTFLSLPGEGVVLIYDHENQYWQPPQTMNVVLAIIGGELYGHSTVTDETFKLFDTETYTHNGNPIESIAAVSYNTFGNRTQQKRFDEYFWEGYASLETKIDITYKYDFGGFTQIIEGKQIDMSNTDIVFYTESDGSFGKKPFGKNPIGSVTDSPQDLPKFRNIHSMNKPGFYEMQVIISTATEGFRWSIISHGPNAMLSTSDSIKIKT
jgi:hypothetical protein